MKLEFDKSLLSHNTFGMNVQTKCLVTYDNPADLLYFLENERQEHTEWPILHIGEGSNLLFLNNWLGYILLSNIQTIEVLPKEDNYVYLRVGSGIHHDSLVKHCVENGWYGLENLSLIPGQVGAAAVQNIGAYGVEVGDFIQQVEAIDISTGTTRVLSHEECQYEYRQSVFKKSLTGHYAITYVTYKLSRTFTPNISYGGIMKAIELNGLSCKNITAEQLRDIIISIRKEKLPDPKEQGNAGSFFMNPVVSREVYSSLLTTYSSVPSYEVDDNFVKLPAGWLIEQTGWKGKSIGNVAVHDKQALVLVNKGGAKPDEILNLSNAITKDVQEKFNIRLTPEVNFIS